MAATAESQRLPWLLDEARRATLRRILSRQGAPEVSSISSDHRFDGTYCLAVFLTTTVLPTVSNVASRYRDVWVAFELV